MLLRRAALACAYALAAIALLLAMRAGAARIVAGELQHDAQRQLAALRAGHSPWAWPLRVPDDLVAGRVFGAARLDRGRDGLRITSRDGTPFELGLPLARPADAAHWPMLDLDIETSQAGTLALAAAHAGETPCRADPAAPLPSGRQKLAIDLRRLPWQSDTGRACPSPAVIDYLFRLRIQVPSGATVILHAARLATEKPVPLPASGPHDATLVLPANFAAARTLLAEASAAAGWPAVPLIRLPFASAEDLLALRDMVREHAPAALLASVDTAIVPEDSASASPRPAWLLCGAYTLAMAMLAKRPRRHAAKAWLDIAAVMAGPLWLIAGLHLGRPGIAPEIAAFVVALLYAWHLGRQPENGPGWRWQGNSWPEWLMPWLPLPVVLALLAVQGRGLIHPAPGHVLAYVGWAALQQWLMLAVVLRRAETILPRAAAVLAVAALFAVLHTPNGRLMQLCLLAEVWWAGCFLRSRALLPVALAHAGCALLVEAGLVGPLLRSLEVSDRFFF